ncbi:DUF945 family protein [Thorsellia kenyensis]|uniref:DUF945 family protein n=1 Tax=Thorsellia kenyensis TaxID=1549888 RepID=A0ABV6C809_9GAMM
MKKFTFISIFILILFSAYFGFGYYANHVSKQKIEDTSEKINVFLSSDKRITSLNKTITLKTSLEEKSLFKSVYKLTFEISDNNANPNDRNARKRLTLNLTSENGLFPLSNLKNFNFSPVVNKMTLEFPANLLSKDFLDRGDVDKSVPLADILFTTRFDESIHIKASIRPLKYTDQKFPFTFDGGIIELSLNDKTISSFAAELNNLDAKFNSPWIPIGHIIDNVIKQTEESTRHHFKFKRIKLNYTINPSTLNFFTSKKSFEVEDFSFAILQYPILKFSNFFLDQEQIDRSNIIEIENNFKLSDLNTYGLNMGSGHSTFISLHRNFEAVDTFYNSIISDIKLGKYIRTTLNTELSLTDFIFSAQALTRRLVSNPGYQIIPFQWKNSLGTLTINSELIFSNPLTYSLVSNPNGQINNQQAYDKINSFHIDVSSENGMLPYLMTQIDQINGIEQLVAKEKNNLIVEKNIDLLINTGIITRQNDLINFAFSYTNDRYVLNGVAYTRDQFLEFISLVSLRQTGLISPENLIRLNEFISGQTSE